MFSAEFLRAFVNERMTAAAEEIFRVFEITILEYEEEIGRQRRLLDVVSKPEIKLARLESARQDVCKEEEEKGVAHQQLFFQEMNSSLEDPEPPQIKEEQEELCTSLEVEQLVLKQETETCAYEESVHNDPEATSDHQLFLQNSHVSESQDVEDGEDGDSSSSGEPRTNEMHHQNNVLAPNLSEVHTNTHPGGVSYTCGTCGKSFQYNSRLQRHLRVHTGEKPFLCSFCGQKFAYMSALKTHSKIHTGEKPFSCQICGKDFILSTSLKSHMRTHTGEKPFFCIICGKTFCTKPPLRRHMKVHTGEKPFGCKTCGKRFCRTSELKTHLTIHTGEKPYSCKICGKAFRLNNVLKVHMRTHTGEKPYLCKTCGSDFSCVSGLLVHMRRAHRDETP